MPCCSVIVNALGKCQFVVDSSKLKKRKEEKKVTVFKKNRRTQKQCGI